MVNSFRGGRFLRIKHHHLSYLIQTIKINPTKDILEEELGNVDILITSNHFTRTLGDLGRILPNHSFHHDFKCILDKAKPKKIIFALHDHTDLYVDQEDLYL